MAKMAALTRKDTAQDKEPQIKFHAKPSCDTCKMFSCLWKSLVYGPHFSTNHTRSGGVQGEKGEGEGRNQSRTNNVASL